MSLENTEYRKKYGVFKTYDDVVNNNILSLLELKEDDVFLDIGFGAGALLKEAIKITPNVYGIDYLKESVDLLKKEFNVKHGDIREIPYKDGMFSKITAIGVINYLDKKDLDLAFKEISRVINKNKKYKIIIRFKEPINKIGDLFLFYYKKIRGSEYKYVDNYFSRNFLIKIAKKYGFSKIHFVKKEKLKGIKKVFEPFLIHVYMVIEG